MTAGNEMQTYATDGSAKFVATEAYPICTSVALGGRSF